MTIRMGSLEQRDQWPLTPIIAQCTPPIDLFLHGIFLVDVRKAIKSSKLGGMVTVGKQTDRQLLSTETPSAILDLQTTTSKHYLASLFMTKQLERIIYPMMLPFIVIMD